MKGLSKLMVVAVIFPFLFLLLFSSVLAQEKAAADIKAELPVLLTSCGQSPGPIQLKAIMTVKRYNVNIVPVLSLFATADTLIALKNAGNPVKTIIIVTGASLKGMGAAGISIKDELERTEKLIAEANKQGILVIGAHIEGLDRRIMGAAEGDNSDELSIDAVCPKSGLLLVRKDGNPDGRFTTISKNKEIPMIEFEKNADLTDILNNLFKKK
ncbi:hypothetical protein AMJ80_04415 [bacterium SM23_31]|nr:MAG: hypothetical protein AMJ80_04415 [bacterium SM23_31]